MLQKNVNQIHVKPRVFNCEALASNLAGMPCCVLEQVTFTPLITGSANQKIIVEINIINLFDLLVSLGSMGQCVIQGC